MSKSLPRPHRPSPRASRAAVLALVEETTAALAAGDAVFVHLAALRAVGPARPASRSGAPSPRRR
jgi:hypothetical protein